MNNMTKLWIVGKLIPNPSEYNTWEVQGIFDSEVLAKTACKSPYHFIGPVCLNEMLPEETHEWPGAYFPNDFK